MRVVRGLDRLPPLPRPSAVAVGNFDGLHLGHRRILARLCALARSQGWDSVVLTFDPHPERALGKRSVQMIETLEQRLKHLEGTSVDAAVVTAFDGRFARLSARDFVEGVLRDRLGARLAVVGQNFRFGRGRQADAERLRALGAACGLDVHIVPPAVLGGRPVSSTAVRRLLAHGKVEEAARLLGRPYEIVGRVVPGSGRGRLLGYPTANLETPNEIKPEGVFITETVLGGRRHPSLTSIGRNPTFGPHPLSVETLLLDFRGRLYGRKLAVRFLRRLRPLRKFPDSAALSARIGQDIEEARRWFQRRGRVPQGGR